MIPEEPRQRANVSLRTIVVGPLQVNCYLLGCVTSGQAVVIDPGDNAHGILLAARQSGLRIVRILATHAHFDHLLACRDLQAGTGASLYLHPGDRPVLAALQRTAIAWLGSDPGEPPFVQGDLTDGELVQVGEIVLEVRHTPGHSPGGVTLVEHANRRAFSGDTLFAGAVGRADLPGGDMETLIASIRRQILILPDDYAVFSGHGAATTVGRERSGNPFLTGSMNFGRRA